MAFVQSTEIHTGSDAQKSLQKSIDLDLGKGGTSSLPSSSTVDLPPIVVHAMAKGLSAASVSIPVSDNPLHLTLAIAAAASHSQAR